MKIKQKIPWWTKIFLKIILARLPFNYQFWQNIGLFRHGKMDNTQYAIEVFLSHVKKSEIKELKEKTIMEVGPGDSISSAIISYSYGAKSILLDVGRYAKTNTSTYLKLSNNLKKMGYSPPDIVASDNLEKILIKSSASYLTAGYKDLKKIKSESIDLIYSQAVLEHISLDDFKNTFNEFYRILKKGGVSSHQVDLRDHLDESLNNLRFSEKIWESKLFTQSGFYTNRIRFDEMIAIFKDSKFNVEIKNILKWDKLPLPKSKLNKKFQSVPEDVLKIKVFDVILRK